MTNSGLWKLQCWQRHDKWNSRAIKSRRNTLNCKLSSCCWKDRLLGKLNCWPIKTVLTVWHFVASQSEVITDTAGKHLVWVAQHWMCGLNWESCHDMRVSSGFQNSSFQSFSQVNKTQTSSTCHGLISVAKCQFVNICNAGVVFSLQSVKDTNFCRTRCQLSVQLHVSVLLQLQRVSWVEQSTQVTSSTCLPHVFAFYSEEAAFCRPTERSNKSSACLVSVWCRCCS